MAGIEFTMKLPREVVRRMDSLDKPRAVVIAEAINALLGYCPTCGKRVNAEEYDPPGLEPCFDCPETKTIGPHTYKSCPRSAERM